MPKVMGPQRRRIRALSCTESSYLVLNRPDEQVADNFSHRRTSASSSTPTDLSSVGRRKISFENNNDVTTVFLSSDFASGTKRVEDATNRHNKCAKKPKTLSKLSRSGCLSSLVEAAKGVPAVSEDNLSDCSKSEDKQNINSSSALRSVPMSYPETDCPSSPTSCRSSWGQFVDVIPLENDSFMTLSPSRNASCYRTSRLKTLLSRSHYMPYLLPSPNNISSRKHRSQDLHVYTNHETQSFNAKEHDSLINEQVAQKMPRNRIMPKSPSCMNLGHPWLRPSTSTDGIAKSFCQMRV